MRFNNIFIFLFIIGFSTPAFAQKYISSENVEITKEWNGNNFTSTQTFSENIAEAPQFAILSKILKDSKLQSSLEAKEMITIFAITDDAFLQLPKKSRDSIIGNTALMTAMVKYLTIPGRVDSNSLKDEIKKNNGKTYVRTLNGEALGIQENNGKLQLVDSENRTATIVASDFYHKNGFFHIVSGLVFPAVEE